MSTTTLYRRIRRRETHSPRSGAAVVVGVAAVLALAWLATETVLAALGRHALLLSPARMVAGIAALPTVASGALIGSGVVLAILGLIVVVLGLSAGRLGRHTIDDDRAVIVVHDEVVGSALVRAAADSSSTDPDRAIAAVGRRRATVRLTPTSGSPIDLPAVQQAVAERLQGFGLQPALTTRIVLDRKGRVGA